MAKKRGRPKGSIDPNAKSRKTQSERVREGIEKKHEEAIQDAVLWDVPNAGIKKYASPTTNIVRDNKGRITHGSKGLNTRFSMQEIEERFLMAAEGAYNGEFYSVEEAQIAAGLMPATWYRYCREYPHIKEVSEAIKAACRAHLNRKALENEIQPIVAMFRMKVLGDIEASKDVKPEEVKTQPIIDLSQFE